MQTIKPAELKELVSNQVAIQDKMHDTSRAVFKLSEVESLLKSIYYYKALNPEMEEVDVCITFVRVKINKDKSLDDTYHICGEYLVTSDLINYSQQGKDGNLYTQLIPLMLPCILNPPEFNFKDKINDFKYARLNGEIPFIHAGGEGSGLIPPPPPGSGDDGEVHG